MQKSSFRSWYVGIHRVEEVRIRTVTWNQALTMHRRVLAAAFFVLALPVLANGQTWTSPDGFLSVTPPDATLFQVMPAPPPPFVGLWVSNDETMKFGVIQTDFPLGKKLIQSSVEEGLAEELGGDVTRLPTKQVSGHEVWNMTAKGPVGELTQAIVRHEGVVYKLMALTLGNKPDATAINRFIDSLTISVPLPSMTQASNPPDTQPVQAPGGGDDLHRLSKAIGGAGALLGIGALVYLILRGKTKRKS